MSTAVATKTIVHLGCGRKRWPAAQLFPYVGLRMDTADVEIVHVDADPLLEPDMVCKAGADMLQMADNSADAIIAWHVLEHIGTQGDTREWFAFWEDAYRVLKPGGFIYGESPYYSCIWAWSDPTHSRALSEQSFTFFCQDSYRIPQSAISPYRIRCDFQWMSTTGLDKGWAVITDPTDARKQALRFMLAARKPLRAWWEE